MNAKQFKTKLNQLKRARPKCDYHIDLYYQGVNIGCIYGENSNLDEIEIDDRQTYLLVYTDTFGLFVDNAELRSI